MDGLTSDSGSLSKEKARDKLQEVKEGADDAAEQFKERLKKNFETSRHEAGKTAEKVRDRGEDFLDKRRKMAAQEADNVASALKKAAESLREGKDDTLAEYVEGFADRVDGISRSLRDQTPRELVRRLGEMAERKPEWFVAGMFAAGVTLARFLKASPDKGSSSSPDYDEEKESAPTDAYPESFSEQASSYATGPDFHTESEGRR